MLVGGWVDREEFQSVSLAWRLKGRRPKPTPASLVSLLEAYPNTTTPISRSRPWVAPLIFVRVDDVIVSVDLDTSVWWIGVFVLHLPAIAFVIANHGCRHSGRHQSDGTCSSQHHNSGTFHSASPCLSLHVSETLGTCYCSR